MFTYIVIKYVLAICKTWRITEAEVFLMVASHEAMLFVFLKKYRIFDVIVICFLRLYFSRFLRNMSMCNSLCH